MTSLTIYKASAGSGKTFTLATEYIAMLVRNPLSYRNILAVTFTNKATEEMKQRIMSQLYGISRALPDSQDYLEKIMEKTGMGEEEIRRNCALALTGILHHYNEFRVQTIDAFFQSVLKNLAHELQLTANLKVELNDKQVEQQAVDLLIEELTEDKELMKWIMDFINERLNEDKSWDVVDDIKSFGQILLKDFYKEISEKLNKVLHKKGFFEDYTKKLKQVKADCDKQMLAYAEKFENLCSVKDLNPLVDFKGKKNSIASYFMKIKAGSYSNEIRNKTVENCLDGLEGWLSKDSKVDKGLIETCFIPLLRDTEKKRPELLKRSSTAEMILKNLSKLHLLQSIEGKMREINQERGQFLLGDTQHTLKKIINGSDTPFIFEKIGTKLEHIMIDEFQDTSGVQWNNFRILLDQCMDSNNDGGNLIVGDVKQSIYRWRSGDWRLLNNLKDKDFAAKGDMVVETTLDTNFRSLKNIVDFNNALFKVASAQEVADHGAEWGKEAEQMTKAYSDVMQLTPDGKKKEGLVRMELFNPQKYPDYIADKVLDIIHMLKEEGASYNDIAILGRKNDQLSKLAKDLIARDGSLPLVSDEAFLLSSSTAVQLIVNVMKYVAQQEPILMASIADNYCMMTGHERTHDALFFDQEVKSLLPIDLDNEVKRLATMPLYDMAEEIAMLFGVSNHKKESAYVCTFFDHLASFVNDITADLPHFIEAWDESIGKKSIQSDAVNGIRMLTIHKSKGLEFNHLIVPYCDWKIEPPYPETLWVEPQLEPMSELPVVPMECTKQLSMTEFYDEYQEEKLQESVDNMNLMYVAFTRAGQNLFVLGERQGRTKTGAFSATELRSKLLEEVMPQLEKELEGSIVEDADDVITFTYGELRIINKDKKKSQNIFEVKPDTTTIDTQTHPLTVDFRQSNKSDDFVRQEEMTEEEAKQQTYLKQGLLLHRVFEEIRTYDDIDKVLKQLELEGVIENSIEAAKIRKLLYKRLESPVVKAWFEPGWKLFNECNILWKDDEGKMHESRPDRVMVSPDGAETIVVDYKFGSPSTPRLQEYKEQVNKYVTLLTNMGHKNVKGYLWFVYKNVVEWS